MDFALFILVNAALFIRPSEIAPPLAAVPIYQILILLCLAVSSPVLISQWTSRPLSGRPVTVCMLGLLFSVMISHVGHLDFAMARYCTIDFARVVLYFVLFVAIVNTPGRLRAMLVWILAFIAAMTALALCQYYGVVNIPTLKILERSEEDSETGEVVFILQLVGTGIFNDPNDFSLILAFGCLISLYLSGDRRFGPPRVLWLGFFGVFVHAIILTQSRGGLIALVAGVLALLATLIGPRRALLASMITIPLALPLIGGRLARISTNADTAQERMHLWQEDALGQFRRSPLFGIGVNTLADEIGLVAHNSYVHAYAEMGFLGGTSFVGVFLSAALILRKMGRPDGRPVNDESRRLRPYLLGMLVAFVVGLYSLTRCYVAPTYVSVALIEAYQQIANPDRSAPGVRVGQRFLATLLLVSLGCLVGISLFIRIFVH